MQICFRLLCERGLENSRNWLEATRNENIGIVFVINEKDDVNTRNWELPWGWKILRWQWSHGRRMYFFRARNILDDFREAYYWLRQNTDDNARVMSWWDYGYQIAGMANRTTLVDNNTWNNSHIALVRNSKTLGGVQMERYNRQWEHRFLQVLCIQYERFWEWDVLVRLVVGSIIFISLWGKLLRWSGLLAWDLNLCLPPQHVSLTSLLHGHSDGEW